MEVGPNNDREGAKLGVSCGNFFPHNPFLQTTKAK